uniref:3'-5' exonuclease domain-containing protein n=1 Tax=Octactis speculum TaxID=3111310 RepID=A0A7S2GX10_9STRA|mmetsp:Transcript_58861/g.80347  ORF Transcript_58861/g.80347 Transcript_58861/m.80347 type:complete len:280 (+) Transcript_58861:76-915(+)|eukprot:CAMPEP_0185748142 /NCGR_PEP_ID=MMETSP1174-20130828/6812_1 /TAXON_ID=35687 /ORGANISM="Dictyocha speculum, Strain CCMP1381" /LENGTH=279 /DNA_ID=CAMNT_0028423663 /DNA_START=75 /DNA_END=914 /DNA_ORIENTATION=-
MTSERLDRKRRLQEMLDTSLTFVLDIPDDRLIYVQNGDGIIQAEEILRTATIIGIDTETQPTFYKYGARNARRKSEGSSAGEKGGEKTSRSPGKKQKFPRNPCALLQIAVRDAAGLETVLLFDTLRLLPGFETELSTILGRVFRSHEVLKLGHGLKQDLFELHASYPLKGFKALENVLEVDDLSKVVWPGDQMRSLQVMVLRFLDSALNKKQQCSNWGHRPLSLKQMEYAACDALVLLRLYDAIRAEIGDRDANFDLRALRLDFAVREPEAQKETGLKV